jgi:hypothetical protein
VATAANTMDPETETDFEHEVSLTEPWRNPENILLLYIANAPLDKGRNVGKINIYVPIADARDYNNGKYKARISSCGRNIIVTLPSLPYYFWKRTAKDNMPIQHVEESLGGKGEPCGRTTEEHNIKATEMATDTKKLHKTLTLILPSVKEVDGRVTVNNDSFNDGAEGLNLIPRFRRCGSKFKKQDGIAEVQSHLFVWFSVALDGTERKLAPPKKQNTELDEISTMFASTLIVDSDDED